MYTYPYMYIQTGMHNPTYIHIYTKKGIYDLDL